VPDVTTNPAVGALLREVRHWLRAHPYALDGLIAMGAFLAILLGASTVPHGHDVPPHFGERDVHPLTISLAVLACSALVLRRRSPMPVLCVTTVITVFGLITGPSIGATAPGERAPLVATAIIALYTVSNRTDRVTSLRVGAVTVGVLTAASMLFGDRPWYAQENFGIFAWTGLAAAAGEAVRSRRAFVAAIRERAERAERTREEEARRRVAEERMRIARELHDVVAHHIALVNVQAGVASHVMDQRPDQAKEALAHVREASRHALNELQATVGLLRQSGESTAPTEPAPGLGVLDELVESFTRAGMSVSVSALSADATVRADVAATADRAATGGAGDAAGTVEQSAAETELPSAIDLTAYRVVQEALTNVQKHVGAGAHAEVRIVTDQSALEVTVTDDGGGDGDAEPEEGPDGPDGPHAEESAEVADSGGEAVAGEKTSGGHGLIGMRERAVALHGVCETGPLPGGGFRVYVRLPIQHPEGDAERDMGREEAEERRGPQAQAQEGASA
jgi:signal transduction histidine kinase